MKDLIKKVIVEFIPSFFGSKPVQNLLSNFPTSEHARFLKSLKNYNNLDGFLEQGLPWWSLNAIDKVDELLDSKEDIRVFEFGSGASTLWLASRAKEVISIEYDQEFYDIMKDKLSSHNNVILKYIAPEQLTSDNNNYTSSSEEYLDNSFKNYVSSLAEQEEKFDLIVIDGRCREMCLEVAIDKLSPDGIIVFDDTIRDRYQNRISPFLKNNILVENVNIGFAPSTIDRQIKHQTSIITFSEAHKSKLKKQEYFNSNEDKVTGAAALNQGNLAANLSKTL